MLTPSDTESSDKSHRERIKTPFEIMFEEEPVFSDSEEEADFLRANFGLSASQSDFMLPPENLSLTDQILKVCCNECLCCQRIRIEIIESHSKRQHNSDLAQAKQAKKRKVKNSTKINIISNQLIEKPSSKKKGSPKAPEEAVSGAQENLFKNISLSDTTTSFSELLDQLNQENNNSKISLRNSNTRPASIDSAAIVEIQEKILSNSNGNPQPNLVRQRLDFGSEENSENKNVVNKPKKRSRGRPKSKKLSQKSSEDEQPDIVKQHTTGKPSRGLKARNQSCRKPAPLEKKQLLKTPNGNSNISQL